MTCSYCGEPAVRHIARAVGEAPADPRRHGTQADERKLEDVHFCMRHWTRLTTFLDVALRLP